MRMRRAGGWFAQESNRTCAMAAAASGSARVLRAILERANIADELMMPIRMHALHEAAKNGHLEVIQVRTLYSTITRSAVSITFSKIVLKSADEQYTECAITPV